MLRAFVGNNLSKFLASIALCLYGALTYICVVAADFKDEYQWSLPPGFPKPAIPLDNPMSAVKVQLGCRLFFDTRLSSNGAYACASCHRPELAFSDGRVTAVGATGESVRRNAMSLTNVAYNTTYTWASKNIITLEAQMERPLFGAHPLEMGLPKSDTALRKAIDGADYARSFHDAFPNDQEPISIVSVTKAIAAYERTLISGRSAFDRYVFDDVRDALSATARRGMSIFFSERGGCAACHSGLNFSGSMVHERAKTPALFANTGLYNIDGRGAYPASDTGLLEESNAPSDMGKFRVPTLRNVALTAPYMHDGSIATLKEVVEHYSRGGRQALLAPTATNKLRDPKIRPLSLTSAERDDLVAFLESLTDSEFVAADRHECSRIHATKAN
jgi:cytochrome c peroxidase